MIGLLFDIDGTLLDTQGQGVQAFVQGIRDTWQLDDDLSWIEFAGATDLDILRRIAAKCGISLGSDSVASFFTCYGNHLREAMDPSRVQLKPHVETLLQELHERSDVALGLVTGNARCTAYIKLEAGGIDHHFPDGGFGDEDPVRAELVNLAHRRMVERVGECDLVAVIGDTPNDITAALQSKVRAIGVATGKFSSEELVAISSEATIFSDLEHLAQTMDKMR